MSQRCLWPLASDHASLLGLMETGELVETKVSKTRRIKLKTWDLRPQTLLQNYPNLYSLDSWCLVLNCSMEKMILRLRFSKRFSCSRAWPYVDYLSQSGHFFYPSPQWFTEPGPIEPHVLADLYAWLGAHSGLSHSGATTAATSHMAANMTSLSPS